MTPPPATLPAQMEAVTRLFTQDQTTPHPLTATLPAHPAADPGAPQATTAPTSQAPQQPHNQQGTDSPGPIIPPPAFQTPHTAAPTAPVFIPAHTRVADLLPTPNTDPQTDATPDETYQVDFTPVAETVEAHAHRQQSVRAVIEELSWLDD